MESPVAPSEPGQTESAQAEKVIQLWTGYGEALEKSSDRFWDQAKHAAWLVVLFLIAAAYTAEKRETFDPLITTGLCLFASIACLVTTKSLRDEGQCIACSFSDRRLTTRVVVELLGGRLSERLQELTALSEENDSCSAPTLPNVMPEVFRWAAMVIGCLPMIYFNLIPLVRRTPSLHRPLTDRTALLIMLVPCLLIGLHIGFQFVRWVRRPSEK